MKKADSISTLRQMMAEENVAAVIVPSCDPHMSEYTSSHFKIRHFISHFTGSAGTAVFLQDKWGLWTDGRYYIQAKKQISPFDGILFPAAEASCPSIPAFLSSELPKGSVVSMNGALCSRSFSRELEQGLCASGIQVRYDLTLAENAWVDRPAPIYSPIWSVSKATEQSAAEKIHAVRSSLSHGADALLTAKLDSTAWLFNIRAEDVPYVPVPLAWSLITRERAVLFTELSRIPQEVRAELQSNGVKLLPYDAVYAEIKALQNCTLQMDPEEINMVLWTLALDNSSISIAEAQNPIPFLKAVKNHLEIEHTKAVYLEDCIALCEFYAQLEQELQSGASLTEYDVGQLLENSRWQRAAYHGSSFAPIIGFGENAAMMHYAPSPTGSKEIAQNGLLLIDTGGHYTFGTTDITRTYALGQIGPEERLDYTTVIKGFISLHTAVFPDGTPGRELDNLCRVHFWRRLLDYRCGTGHGVGFLLNIHEGPHGFGVGARRYPLHSGMYLTIEPGIYREGMWGIRCENAVYVEPYGESEYGNFLCFKAFTFLPIDPAPLLVDQLDDSEIAWLNQYNQSVRDTLLPLLSESAAAWVESRTKPIEK